MAGLMQLLSRLVGDNALGPQTAITPMPGTAGTSGPEAFGPRPGNFNAGKTAPIAPTPRPAPRNGGGDPFASIETMVARPNTEEEMASYLATEGPPSIWSKMGANLEKNVGGWAGGLSAASDVMSSISLSLAPGGGGIGVGLARGAMGLDESFARGRNRQDERELSAYVDERLADPNITPGEREMLEAYGKGGRDLAQLQLSLGRQEGASARKGLPTATRAQADRQSMNRWNQIAGNGLGGFNIDTLDQQGSWLNDAMKQWWNESDEDYSLRLQYVKEKGDMKSDARRRPDDPGIGVAEPYAEWLARNGYTGVQTVEDDSGAPAGEAVGAALNPPAQTGDLDDLEAQLLAEFGPSAEPFSERALGLPPTLGAEASGVPGEAGADFGIFSGIESTLPRPRRSTVKRERELTGGIMADVLQGSPEIDTSGVVRDPARLGLKARRAFGRGLGFDVDQYSR